MDRISFYGFFFPPPAAAPLCLGNLPSNFVSLPAAPQAFESRPKKIKATTPLFFFFFFLSSSDPTQFPTGKAAQFAHRELHQRLPPSSGTRAGDGHRLRLDAPRWEDGWQDSPGSCEASPPWTQAVVRA